MPTADPQTSATQTTNGRARRMHNFSAGPATLPVEVLEQVREELPHFKDTGASVMEISHRSPAYDEVEESARALIKKLLGLGQEWHVLFLQGGASMQFHQVPLNFLPEGGSADYLITGRWSDKALAEANTVGQMRGGATARAAASGETEKGYTRIPSADEWDLDESAAYLHYTSNNTVAGTQFHFVPEAPAPLVTDASSDFLSRPIEHLERFGLIYAGAQKNIGPAGVTVVLLKDDFLKQRVQPLPTMLDYGTHTAKRFNTPPVFAIYVVEKVMRWLENKGGVEGIREINERKAGRLYDRIDATDFYTGAVEKDARSLMNATFRLPSEELEAQFVSEAKGEGLLALKGHRSVGGVRASMYNALPEEAVEALVTFMDEFERARG